MFNELIDAICRQLNIIKKTGSVNEQLIDSVNQAAAKGTFIVDLNNFKITCAEVVKGRKIEDVSCGSLINFEASNTHLLRSLSYKKENNDD